MAQKISGLRSKGTENFRKTISKILVNLSRLSFFPEIFRSFDISSQHDSSPVSLALAVSVASTKGKDGGVAKPSMFPFFSSRQTIWHFFDMFASTIQEISLLPWVSRRQSLMILPF